HVLSDGLGLVHARRRAGALRRALPPVHPISTAHVDGRGAEAVARGQEVKREGVYGLLAEFETVEALQRAATSLLIHGYRHVRICTPYAVKEVTGLFTSFFAKLKTLAISPVVFAGGAGAAVTAFLVQEYANVVDYALNVGGRPTNRCTAF